jgi:predicted DNA-binding WGR domain protein
LRKCQPAQLVSQWGRINYDTYEFIKQFVPGKVQVGTSNYTMFCVDKQTVKL